MAFPRNGDGYNMIIMVVLYAIECVSKVYDVSSIAMEVGDKYEITEFEVKSAH